MTGLTIPLSSLVSLRAVKGFAFSLGTKDPLDSDQLGESAPDLMAIEGPRSPFQGDSAALPATLFPCVVGESSLRPARPTQ